MPHRLALYTLLLAFFTISALSLTAQDLESGVRVNINGQEDENGVYKYYLHCLSHKIFNNGSTKILYRKQRKGKKFHIVFTGTKTPAMVKRSIEPARAFIPLGRLKNGIFFFKFTTKTLNGDVVAEYVLKIYDDSFEWIQENK